MENHRFLKEFINICMTYNYPKDFQEHLKMRIFPLALNDKDKESFKLL